MRRHPDRQVAAALAELEAVDQRAARRARAALRHLTRDQGLETITQHGLQTFLWYELPHRWSVDVAEQRAVTEALGQLLDLLGLPRYAGVCTGEETAAVLAAWAHRESSGLQARRQADQRSGLVPPDLSGHTGGFAWGTARGSQESRAFQATAAALELAAAAGELAPGTRGWRSRQRALARSYLTAPRPELDGGSWLEAISDERRAAWRRSRGQVRRQLVDSIDPLLDDDLPVPAGSADAVEPLRWLLSQAEDGLPLTETRRLGRSLVLQAAQRFGWYDERFPPRTETDVSELHELHRLARELRAVRRRGAVLVLTPRGRALREDPEDLWQVTATELAAGGSFDDFVTELTLAMLALDEACEREQVVDTLTAAAYEEGWRDQDTGQAPDRDTVVRVLWRTVHRMQALGFLIEFGGWREHTLALTLPGRGAALRALRARATGPTRR